MYSWYISTNRPDLTPIGRVWPKFDLWWPQLTSKILNLNSWENFESKHMYIEYISTNPPDLAPIWRVWPKFDLWWPQLTLKNIEFEFLRKFWVESYVYLIYFDQFGGFNHNLTLVWPQMTFGRSKYIPIWNQLLELIRMVYNMTGLSSVWSTWPDLTIISQFDLSLTSNDLY